MFYVGTGISIVVEEMWSQNSQFVIHLPTFNFYFVKASNVCT